MSARDAILEGTLAAQRLHEQLRTRQAFAQGGLSRVDVFKAAESLGALLLFRPLTGLLGAYLGPPSFPMSGILVSTQRDLHVQRFTAAHEIGHLFMEHKVPSLDTQVGLWRGESSDARELAADAFASEFMLPRWLYVQHAKRHGWSAKQLQDPLNVYQLSLRMGASYDATCWGLQGHKILSGEATHALRKTAPKAIKQALLRDSRLLNDSWADVWLIDEHDEGLNLEGGPNDTVIFHFRERASSGYLWNEDQLLSAGFEVLADERETMENPSSGVVTRRLVTRASAAGEHRISLSERRPWNPSDTAAHLSAVFDLQGKERGLPRSARRSAVSA